MTYTSMKDHNKAQLNHHLHTYLTNPPPELAESVKRIKRNGGYQRLLSRLEYVPLGVRADVYVARRDGKLNGNLTQFTSDCIARRVWETIESVAASVWCSRREVRQ